MLPQTISRYHIIAELGRGGMATVYKAYDPQMGREVAIKVLPPTLMHDGEFRARFQREARVLAMLDHPAIVPLYEVGEHLGQPFLVMRYLDGGSLEDRLQHGSLPLNEAARIIIALAPALDVAHQAGVIHRDVKPANILFDQYGAPCLADFGIVALGQGVTRLTTAGFLGTPDYMAPELTRPGGMTHLVDVYAIGITLFQMLTGRLPYQADTPLGVLGAHITEPTPDPRQLRPELPPGCTRIVLQALAKRPEQRYQSAGALAHDLELLLHEPATATIRVETAPTKLTQRTVAHPVEAAPRSMREWYPWATSLIVIVAAFSCLLSPILGTGRSATVPTAVPTAWPTSSTWPTPLPAPAKPAPLPVPAGEPLSLPFVVDDAEYSPALDLIVLTRPDARELILLDPRSGELRTVALPKLPTALAINREGSFAAVGYDALVSLIDLREERVVQDFDVPVLVADVALRDTSWIYAGSEMQSGILAVEVATGEVFPPANPIGAGRGLVRLGPDGQSIYTTDGNSSGYFEKYDLAGGPPRLRYSKMADVNLCYGLWLAAEGRRLLTGCGVSLRMSPDEAGDLLYAGKVEPMSRLRGAAFAPTADQIAVLPQFASSLPLGPWDENRVYFYTYETLNPQGEVHLPTLAVGGKNYEAYGRFIFAEPEGERYYVLARAGRQTGTPRPSDPVYDLEAFDRDLPDQFALITLQAPQTQGH